MVVFVPVFVTDEVEEEVELRLTVTEVPEPDEFDAKGRLPKNSKIKNIYQIRTDPQGNCKKIKKNPTPPPQEIVT